MRTWEAFIPVEEGNVRTLQRFVSDAPWDEDNMITKYRSFVSDDLGSHERAFIFDDSGFLKNGTSPDSIAAVEALPNKIYFVSVLKDTLCWLSRPETITREYHWGRKIRKKTILAAPDSKPLAVIDLARNINDYFWYRRQVSEAMPLT